MRLAAQLSFASILFLLLSLPCFELVESKKLKKRTKVNNTLENGTVVVAPIIPDQEPQSIIFTKNETELLNELTSEDPVNFLLNITDEIEELETEINSTVTFLNQSIPNLIWGEVKNAAEAIAEMPQKVLKPMGEGIKRRFNQIHKKVKEHANNFYNYIVNKSVFSDLYHKIRSFFTSTISPNIPREPRKDEKVAETNNILLAGERNHDSGNQGSNNGGE